jgi:four helix bundle protein
MENEPLIMEKENIIIRKTFSFSLRIINLYNYLRSKKNEFVLSKQILKSGTSIGANVEEAEGGQSKPDFICKIQIALKEAKETRYWLKLLQGSGYITKEMGKSLLCDCNEIILILNSILITSKKNINTK